MKSKRPFLIICMIVFLFILPNCLSYDQVVINSKRWQDVYSGMLYAQMSNNYGSYVIDEGHGQLLLDTLPKDREEVLVIESVDQPYVRNFRTNIESRGFTVDVMGAREGFNLEIADHANASGYIIIDDDYSYNAVSVLPYAAMMGYFVIFCSSDNADDVFSFLSSKGPDEVLLYGYLDREVGERLAIFNPVVINKGDKFSNNLEIVKMFIDEKSVGQVVLSDGTFLEPQFFSGNYPILFIGRSNVLDSTVQFVRDSGIKYAMLVGYDNFNNAVTLKNQADLKVMVKFAKGFNQQQYALDIFSLPQYIYDIGIVSANYNRVTQRLEVMYSNNVESPAVVKSSHNVLVNGDSAGVVGDDAPFYIDSLENKTVAYSIEIPGLADSDSIVIQSELLFGADVLEMEYRSNFQTNVSVISVEDNSEIELIDLIYNKPKKRFYLTVRNKGSESVFVKPEIAGILINEKPETLSTDTMMIDPGEEHEFRLKADLSPADIEDNEEVNLDIWYGARKNALVLLMEERVKLRVSYMTDELKIGIGIGAGIAVIVVVVLIILLLRRRPRRKEKPAQGGIPLPKAPSQAAGHFGGQGHGHSSNAGHAPGAGQNHPHHSHTQMNNPGHSHTPAHHAGPGPHHPYPGQRHPAHPGEGHHQNRVPRPPNHG